MERLHEESFTLLHHRRDGSLFYCAAVLNHALRSYGSMMNGRCDFGTRHEEVVLEGREDTKVVRTGQQTRDECYSRRGNTRKMSAVGSTRRPS